MEDTKNTPSPEEVVDTPVEDSATTQEAVAEEPASQVPEKSVKDVIAEVTGWKDIPDDETAIKRIKDLQSYVGKQDTQKTEEATKKVLESGEFVSKKQYETDMFFKDNAQYSRDRDIIEALAIKNNVTVREAVELDTYKNTAEKISGYEKSQESENVLKSNPRITETRNTVEKSRTALKEGDYKSAEDQSIKAVLENLGN